METINSYINNMFAALPQTEQIRKVKAGLLESMTDKYNELKQAGKSENEAVGIVISEFGNIDDLLKEMNISPISGTSTDEPTVWLSQQEAENYLTARKKNLLWTAIGVVLIMWGVIAMMLSAEFMAAEAVPVVLLLMFVAVAVTIFIVAGTQFEKYRYVEAGVSINPQTRKEYMDKQQIFQPSYTIALASGVFLCIFAVAAFLLISCMGENEDANGLLGVCVMLFLISVAVFMFIYIVGQKEGYEAILGTGEYRKENRESSKIVGIVASVVWPLTVVAFLIWGLAFNGFHIAWILFPVVGILFGGFAAISDEIWKKKN